MIRQMVFCVSDSKVGAFAQPWISPTRAAAVRAFADEVRNPQSMMHKHPEDYTLFFVGEFDQATGMLHPAAAPESIVTAITLKEAS